MSPALGLLGLIFATCDLGSQNPNGAMSDPPPPHLITRTSAFKHGSYTSQCLPLFLLSHHLYNLRVWLARVWRRKGWGLQCRSHEQSRCILAALNSTNFPVSQLRKSTFSTCGFDMPECRQGGGGPSIAHAMNRAESWISMSRRLCAFSILSEFF
jgi:hypothetical protein